MDRIAVVIPCFNEAATIGKVIRDTREALPEAVIYVYDNNSTDDTAQIARDAGAIVRREYQQGKGFVCRRMFREVDALCTIITDGDDTYPMEAAREMADRILNHQADMVVGDRLSGTYFNENKRPFHNFGNTLVRGTINRLFDCDIRDIMTGFRAFSYEFVKTFPVLSTGFEIETEMTIHAVHHHMQVENVVVEYRDRPEGSSSKLNTVPDGLKVLLTILKLYRDYKPMPFFSLIACFLLFIATIFFVPVLADWVRTGLVARFPTLIVCGFVALAALLSLFAGIILSSIVSHELRNFEINLNLLSRNKT